MGKGQVEESYPFGAEPGENVTIPSVSGTRAEEENHLTLQLVPWICHNFPCDDDQAG